MPKNSNSEENYRLVERVYGEDASPDSELFLFGPHETAIRLRSPETRPEQFIEKQKEIETRLGIRISDLEKETIYMRRVKCSGNYCSGEQNATCKL